MVRVIEQAALKQTTCRICRCKLEYGFNDMTFRMNSDYTGDRETIAEIKCPNCSNRTYVPVIF